MDFTTENIEQIVSQFYTDLTCQQEANKWLTAAQLSPQAWHICWELLAPNKPPEVQYFGASCILVKIQRCWSELSKEQSASLKSQLLQYIVNFAGGPKIILTRLCIALAAYLMHTIPELWTGAIHDLITTFHPSNLPQYESSQVCSVLLEILTVIPEELPTCHLTKYRQSVVKQELLKDAPNVLSLLGSLTKKETPALVYEQALKCIQSWVQLGVPLPDAEPLLSQVFESVRDDTYFETSIETLIKVFNQPDNYRLPHLIERLLSQVVSLEDLLQKAIADRDVDVCQELTKFVVTAAHNNTSLILTLSMSSEEKRLLVHRLVNMVLMCTNIPGYFPVDECYSDMSFGFWYELQDGITDSPQQQYIALSTVYTPVYMSLVNILLLKVQFPPETEYQTWNADEKENHRCYREGIADTFMYAYNFLHENLLGCLCNLFESITQQSRDEQSKWQELEAVLFALTAIATNVDEEESVFLPKMMSILPSIPCTNQRLVSQALYLMGSYAKWVCDHPQHLPQVIPLILQGLKNRELAQPATIALIEIVSENQSHLAPLANDIIPVIRDALENNVMKVRDSVRLMSSLGYVLSVLPLTEIMDHLNVLLTPHLQQLQHLASLQRTAANKIAVQSKLNMLSSLFNSLDTKLNEEGERPKGGEPQPVLLILQKLLPILPNVLENWISDAAVIETVIEMLKRAVRTLHDDIEPVLNDTLTLTVQMFNSVPHPIILDLAKQLLLLFGGRDTCKSAFHMLCNNTLTLFEGSINDHTDLVKAFMDFLAQLAKKKNLLFADPQCNIVGLFHAGIVGLTLAENPTVKSSCIFLSEIISCTDKIPAIKEVIKIHGHVLVDRIVRAIAGESTRQNIDKMSDVLFALNKHHFDDLCRWLNQVVNQENFPHQRVTRQEKEQFARSVIMEKSNKRRTKEIVSEYTLIWRGLHGTEYGHETQRIMGLIS